MMLNFLSTLALSPFVTVDAQAAHSLVGTWSSKSKAVVTGPGFFNPLTDSLFEPEHTGISYSFTADGHYESAIYTIAGNPTTPECPTGVLQWAHGSYVLTAGGGIEMTPIAVDGRQLLSQPCKSSQSTYIRYSTVDSIKSYSIAVDDYRGEWSLTLNKLYGAPVQPLYLVYDPPQMLPTTTLLPTGTASAKSKRDLSPRAAEASSQKDPLELMWYSSWAMVVLGGIGYLCV